ncbi:MAG: type IX secretion system membrane protein PorP/SprF [Bacteroidales bacterium]|nr:type IX secretion system membrane protein PorP/SprF [Bacteroidales bacterium]
MKIKSIHIILLLISFNAVVYAQDAQFSQFYANPLYLSPSFAGSTDGSRAVINFRDQWPAIPGSFITFSASIDHFFPRYNSGLGFQVLRDQAGSGHLALTTLALQYSYLIKLNRRWNIRPGLMLNYNVRSIDFYELQFNDQMDIDGNSPSSIETPTMEKVQYPDAGFSLLAYNRLYWGGFMIDHIFNPNQSLIEGMSGVPIKFRLYGGRKFIVANAKRYNEETIKVAFSYKAQGKFDQLDIGAYWNRSPFMFGLWYRGIPLFKKFGQGYANNDAFIVLVGVQYQDITFGYSYDVTISRLFANTTGSHEISIIYEFNQDQKVRCKTKAEIVPCPKF